MVLTKESKGFEALVASPNVAGVVWMLIQHGGLLGGRGFGTVTVWRDGESVYTPSLLVEVGDIAE